MQPADKRIFGLVLAAALIALPLCSAPAATAQPSFFNSTEVRSDNLKPFKKWLGALARFMAEHKAKKRIACNPGPGALKICGDPEWIAFLKSIKDQSPLNQLRLVNARMNKAKYVQDQTNWGQQDYWATPEEFMSRFGDCEDYAIIKYLSLRILGWKDEDLRVVAVKDLNLKVGHAILIAFMTSKKTGKRIPLVLDNQIPQVVRASSIRHYQPIFSINQTHWWRHRTG